MEWVRWFGRWAERDRAKDRLASLRQEYGAHGERVIKLSARTDLARRSAGSTQRAFDFVERVFADATQEYARVGELMERLEGELSRAIVGDFGGTEKALRGIGPKLDELERHLSTWEAQWQQTPHEIDEAARSLAELRVQVEAAAAGAGAPLPLSDRLASLEQHLQRIQRTMAEGNPQEASHLLQDLRIAMQKVSEQAGVYLSGAGAISQAEQDVARTRALLTSDGGDPPSEAVAALAAAEAMLPRLRPALAAGRLDAFQQDLLHLQKQLSTARSARKP